MPGNPAALLPLGNRANRANRATVLGLERIQGAAEVGDRREAVCGGLLEAAEDDRLELLGHTGAALPERDRRRVQMVADELGGRLGVEDLLCGEQKVADDAGAATLA